MKVSGDLRHAEEYKGQANLTAEQRLWSDSWDFLQRLQLGRGKLRYGLAALIPANKRVASSLQKEFIPADDVVCVTMLPMLAATSTRYHKENRPIRLQVNVSRFHRDLDTGQPTLGAGPSHTVFECDGAKHPTQDHPIVRVVDYDPRRGEKEERFGTELFGQTVSSSISVEITAQVDGVFTYSDDLMDGWTVFMLDGLPAYRFPSGCRGQIGIVEEAGSHVSEGTLLAIISGEESFAYRQTVYENGKPDLDDHRVLSPISGDTAIEVDDLYANVFVSVGHHTDLVARFHKDDVASGKVELMPEREVRGTGKFERAKDLPAPCNRVKLRTGDEWVSLVHDDTEGEKHLIAKLVAPVEYGLAEFHPNGKSVWDHVSFTNDIIPVSRPDCKLPLRAIGKMLALGKLLTFHKPGDHRYPKLKPVEDTWPVPYAGFTQAQLNEAAFQPTFRATEELKTALRMAVSPKGDFAIKFPKEGTWKCTGFDDDRYPMARVLFFVPCSRPQPVSPEYDEEEQPDEIDLSDRSWADRKAVVALAEPQVAEEAVAIADDEDDTITVIVPKSSVVYKHVFDGEPVQQGDGIADWVPRQFYFFEQLEELLENNLPWFVNEYLQATAIPYDDMFLLPETHVVGIVSPEQPLMLRADAAMEDGLMSLTPLSTQTLDETFTWTVNRIHYDVTPPHLVDGSGAQSSGKRRRRPRRKKDRTEK